MSHFAEMAPLSTLVRRHGDGEWYVPTTTVRHTIANQEKQQCSRKMQLLL